MLNHFPSRNLLFLGVKMDLHCNFWNIVSRYVLNVKVVILMLLVNYPWKCRWGVAFLSYFFSFTIAVIFGVYANEAGSHVLRSEMLRQLQATEGGYNPEILHKCFGQVRNYLFVLSLYKEASESSWKTDSNEKTILFMMFIFQPVLQ